ncbi:MAG TPA: phosphatidate cytidylyltransferase [Bryobacteraceae bacterium]|nr:phosphatidate cytidylyltransferase [Bryobacteraceae bacterium]
MKRLATAAVLIPLFVWIIVFAPFDVFRFALVIVGALAYYEFWEIARGEAASETTLKGTGRERGLSLLAAGTAGIVLLYGPDPGLFAVLIGMAGMALALRSPELKDALPTAALLTLGVLYIFGAWRFAAEIRLISPHWLMLAMLLSWVGDTFAYYTGKAIGRHKMAPRVSPAKTWEGAAGSVVGAVLAGFVYGHYLIPNAPVMEVLVASAIGNCAGQVGDLCESAFKRGAGVKDSGTLLPGHGGWLDRIDSTLFTLPVFYACLRFY